MRLSLHAGSHKVQYDSVLHAGCPEATKSHFPIPHHTLFENVMEAFDGSGLKAQEVVHAMNPDRTRYFGMATLESPSNEFNMVVGWRNAHDQAFAAGLVLGTGCFVCDNLAFSGEVKFKRRHTRNIMRDLPGIVSQAVGQVGFRMVEEVNREKSYKTAQLSDENASHVMIEALEDGVISSQMIKPIWSEYKEPRHEEFTRDGFSCWRMQQAFTEVLKSRNLFELPKRTQKLTGILDRRAGVYNDASFTVNDMAI